MKRFTQSFSLQRASTGESKLRSPHDSAKTDIAGRSILGVSSPLKSPQKQAFAPGSKLASPNVTYESPSNGLAHTQPLAVPGNAPGVVSDGQGAEQCPVCQQPFSSTGNGTPRIAACLHTICLQCISSLPAAACPLFGCKREGRTTRDTGDGHSCGALFTNWMVFPPPTLISCSLGVRRRDATRPSCRHSRSKRKTHSTGETGEKGLEYSG